MDRLEDDTTSRIYSKLAIVDTKSVQDRLQSVESATLLGRLQLLAIRVLAKNGKTTENSLSHQFQLLLTRPCVSEWAHQSVDQCPLQDQVVCEVAQALLSLQRQDLILQGLYGILTSDPHVLPLEQRIAVLHGLCRAICSSHCLWEWSQLLEFTMTSLECRLELASTTLNASMGHAEQILEHYATLGFTLSVQAVQDLLLQTCATQWEHQVLVFAPTADVTSKHFAQTRQACVDAQQVVDLCASLESNGAFIDAARVTAHAVTKIRFFAEVAVGANLTKIVPRLLNSLQGDETENIMLLGLLIVGLQIQPSCADVVITQLRIEIARHATFYGQPIENGASPMIQALSQAYVAAARAYSDKDSILAAAYALLNLLPGRAGSSTSSITSYVESDGPFGIRSTLPISDAVSDTQHYAVSQALLSSIVYFASSFSQIREVVELSLSMLLQRSRMHSTILESQQLKALAELAILGDDDEFEDVVKFLVEFCTERGSSFAMAAFSCLAQHSRNSPRRVYSLTITLLRLFTSAAASSKKSHLETDTTEDLLHMIFVLSECVTDFTELEDQKGRDLVTAFQNFWGSVVLLDLPDNVSHTGRQYIAFRAIASASPCFVSKPHTTFFDTQLEYNSVFSSAAHRGSENIVQQQLGRVLPHHTAVLRRLSTAESHFVSAVYKVETFRAEAGDLSGILAYFAETYPENRKHLSEALQAVAQQVCQAFCLETSKAVTTSSLSVTTFDYIKKLIRACTDPNLTARNLAVTFMDSLVLKFPSLLCEKSLVVYLLEILTVLRRAVDACYIDPYSPIYTFSSSRISDLSLTLSEDFASREAILTLLHPKIRTWLSATIARTPIECQGLLQNYVDAVGQEVSFQGSEMGRSVALDLARTSPTGSRSNLLPAWGQWKPDMSTIFTSTFGSRQYSLGATRSKDTAKEPLALHLLARMAANRQAIKPADLRDALYIAGGTVLRSEQVNYDVIHHLVDLPIRIFTTTAITSALEVWSWLVDRLPQLEEKFMMEINVAWAWTMRRRKGFFSSSLDPQNPLSTETEYTPTNAKKIQATIEAAHRLFTPHSILINFLSSRYQAYRYKKPHLVALARRVALRTLKAHKTWSRHPMAKEVQLRFLTFATSLLQGTESERCVEQSFRSALYSAALSIFSTPPNWAFGSSRLDIQALLSAAKQFDEMIDMDVPLSDWELVTQCVGGLENVDRYHATGDIVRQTLSRHYVKRKLLQTLLGDEIASLEVWAALGTKSGPPFLKNDIDLNTIPQTTWLSMLKTAWEADSLLVGYLLVRFKNVRGLCNLVDQELRTAGNLTVHIDDSRLIGRLIGAKLNQKRARILLYAKPVTPVLATQYCSDEQYTRRSIVLQYAMRVLEQFPIQHTFFYIPQVVQGLRNDQSGYIERFIFEAASISQLFCHQIIWNMQANCFKDDNATIPDPMKPVFENMSGLIIASLSGDARSFYAREFHFFGEVTSISRKLLPYIKKTKAEKKAKIDEEMAKIKLDVGVYLPSNPDGIVVDIDRNSGRPLQSHAKAPFMATFKVEKADAESIVGGQMTPDTDVQIQYQMRTVTKWQAAIFKVGDDCRQDMLALQIIAQFKNIFEACGLDLRLIPYRVTATGPGQGVIDVVPNATSRDEMGRAKVNDLLSFFKTRFPGQIRFEQARNNFIKSMAGYSLICYIIQIKDRHNGNIMIDGDGHITHIDFGFLFDIGPGGIKFEPNSFKLTHEMVDVMGGLESPGYKMFCELIVKAFLACRPFAQDICTTASLMMGTDLPSFKGQPTIDRLLDRFKPSLSEADAVKHMRAVVADALFSGRSILYDRFQQWTNEIPFHK